MRKRSSIAFRLNSMVALLLVVTCVAVSLINAVFSRQAMENEIKDRTLPAMVAGVAAAVDKQIVSPATTLEVMASHPLFLEWIQAGEDPAKVPLVFQAGKNLAALHGTGGANVVLKNSLNFYQLAGNSQSEKKIDPVGDKWFFDFEASGAKLFVNIHGPTDEHYANMAFINRRISDSSGKFLGVLSTGIGVEQFIARVTGMKIGEKGATFIVRKNGEIMLHSDKNLIGTKLTALPGYAQFADKALRSHDTLFDTVNADGDRILVSSLEIPVLDAVVFSAADTAELFADMNRAVLVSAVAGVCILLLGLLLSTYFVRSIARPLRRVAEYAGDVAAGRTSEKLMVSEGGEIGDLLDAVNAMVDSSRHRMQEIEEKSIEAAKQAEMTRQALDTARETERRVTELVTTMLRVSAEAEAIAGDVARSSGQCADDLGQAGRQVLSNDERLLQVVDAMHAMQNRVESMTRSAAVASESTQTAAEKAHVGESTLESATDAINIVNRRADELRTRLGTLGEKADSIGQILTVISDIADQTNLLALNAAIEAARAGDAGRGFAVVADEVRKLAEKTMQATREVDTDIKEIQTATRASMDGMDGTLESVEKATALARESGEVLGAIVGFVRDSQERVSDITQAAQEQTASTQQVLHSVEESRNVASRTVADIQEVSEAVQDLARKANELRALVVELAHTEQGGK